MATQDSWVSESNGNGIELDEFHNSDSPQASPRLIQAELDSLQDTSLSGSYDHLDEDRSYAIFDGNQPSDTGYPDDQPDSDLNINGESSSSSSEHPSSFAIQGSEAGGAGRQVAPVFWQDWFYADLHRREVEGRSHQAYHGVFHDELEESTPYVGLGKGRARVANRLKRTHAHHVLVTSDSPEEQHQSSRKQPREEGDAGCDMRPGALLPSLDGMTLERSRASAKRLQHLRQKALKVCSSIRPRDCKRHSAVYQDYDDLSHAGIDGDFDSRYFARYVFHADRFHRDGRERDCETFAVDIRSAERGEFVAEIGRQDRKTALIMEMTVFSLMIGFAIWAFSQYSIYPHYHHHG